MDVEPQTLAYPGLIDRWADVTPESVALIDGTRRLTVGALAHASCAVAGGLEALELKAGDRVALWMPNVPAWLVVLVACARLGVTVVSVNTRYRKAEVGELFARTRPRALFLWPGFRGIDFLSILGEVEAAALDSIEFVIAYHEGESQPASPPFAGRARTIAYDALERGDTLCRREGAREAASIIFTTSGTTKAPKLVVHTQASLIDHAFAVAARFGWRAPGTTALQALPFCGTFGLAQANAALAARCPSVLDPAFDAARTVGNIRRHKVTHFFATDDMVARIFGESVVADDFASLRFCGYAKFNPALETLPCEAERRGVTLVGPYGSSELQALFACQDPAADEALRCEAGGRPVSPSGLARVRAASGALAAPREIGELECRGPSLFAGYLDDAEATREAFTADGFFRTGDLGYLREDGSFVFLSRAGDVLRLSGFLVNPAEIESFVERDMAISGCQVVGVERPSGTVPVAFVTLETGGTFDEARLRAGCEGGLARYKVPRRFIPIEAFPVTTSANGTKVQRAKLRQMAEAMLEDDPAAH